MAIRFQQGSFIMRYLQLKHGLILLIKFFYWFYCQ